MNTALGFDMKSPFTMLNTIGKKRLRSKRETSKELLSSFGLVICKLIEKQPDMIMFTHIIPGSTGIQYTLAQVGHMTAVQYKLTLVDDNARIQCIITRIQ